MTGSNTLTTYYAKRIIGDTAAQDATSALLQTGIGIATDTWILNQTSRIPNPNNNGIYYGIKYTYDANSNDKIELYGGSTSSAWVQLNNGNTYLKGKVGINYNPNNNYDNNNINYYLTVEGKTRINDTPQSITSIASSQLIIQNSNGGPVALELLRDNPSANGGSKPSWQIINDTNDGYLYFKNNYGIGTGQSSNQCQDTYSFEGFRLFSGTDNGSGAITKLSIGKSTAPTVELDVNGASNITGNVSIGGTLGVTGATTLSSTLDVTGNTTLSENLSVGGTLGVTDAATLSSTLSVADKVTFTSTAQRSDSTPAYALTVSGDITANKIFNAVWNDYAEYRECEKLMPGICVKENNDGCLTKADARLIPGASIITDTFGYIQGETDKAKTPIAVCGRVLAYTYKSREKYQAGQTVCSAPGGTVDIMTREEIRNYPDAIIGIVSEIPDYEIWGSGNIKVNNRIWIKIK